MVDTKNPAVEPAEWDTVTGLPDDVDGWIRGPYFGFKDEYAQIAGTESPMIIFPLYDAEGERIAEQGYSCGKGWKVLDDGARVEHPTRKNFVNSSIYGQLIDRVVKKINVNMKKYGSPREAKSWNGLGFHWKQELHKTLSAEEGKQTATALMPVEFIGEMEITTPVAKAVKGLAADVEAKLTALAQSQTQKNFVKSAMKVPGVTDNDDLMAAIMDESASGYWATHQKK